MNLRTNKTVPGFSEIKENPNQEKGWYSQLPILKPPTQLHLAFNSSAQEVQIYLHLHVYVLNKTETSSSLCETNELKYLFIYLCIYYGQLGSFQRFPH